MKFKLSASAINKWLLCAQKYKLHYRDRLSAKHEDKVLLQAGLAFHEALEVWKLSGDVNKGIECFVKYPLNSYRRRALEMMFVAYTVVYANDAFTYEYVEKEFSVEHNGTIIRGIFDGIIIDDGNERAIVDHKTTRSDISPGSRYWERLSINTQIDTYLFIANKYLGLNIDYFLYDVIKIPQLRLLKATPKNQREYYKRNNRWGRKGDLKKGQRSHDETIPEFTERIQEHIEHNTYSLFRRQKIYRTAEQIEAFKYDLNANIGLINAAIENDWFPRNTNGCFAYNRECDYYPICSGDTTAENAELYYVRGDRVRKS